VSEQVPASRKLGEERALELITAATKVQIAKGKKLDVYEGGNASEEIVKKMLGATGNLRAPTIVAGGQLLVGFNEEAYHEVLL
jgi:arsenate reductase-like glutaredoxin family protein